jgi:carbonic anhydrase
MIGGAKYDFYQVHWHTPSENSIDGKLFALEAHFVHQLADDALHGTYHRLAVIGLLYELDATCNTFLDKFWGSFPNTTGSAQYTGTNFDLNQKLTDELAKGYYHWYGSLTTPPCTEGVSWNLLKTTEKVCQRQVDALKTALGNTQSGINFNNRVTQPLNHRVVAEMKPGVSPATASNTMPLTTNAKWVYANKGETSANATAQTSTWGGLCVSGKEQSPINVVTASVKRATSKDMQKITTYFNTTVSYVKNTGHGFQLFETSPQKHVMDTNGVVSPDSLTASAKGYSMIGGAKFNFYQTHWHTPSENTVDGKSFAMEAHFVHQLDDTALHGTYHRLAVIGLLYDLGTDSECNTFLDKFWGTFPNNSGTVAFTGTNFDLNTKLTDELANGYWHWYGSLTTPPCTEGVSWNLLRTPEKVCQRQVDTLKTALGFTQHGIMFNNRVTMPLNHRIVTETGPLTEAEKVTKALKPIKVCELNIIYIQQMTAQFLEVASSIHASENREKVKKTMKLFDKNLYDLINGNSDKGIAATTYPQVVEKLDETKKYWTAYKSLLESNVNTVGSSSSAVLAEVHTQSQNLKKKAEALLGKYVAIASLSAIAEPPVLAYAKLQVQYLETIFADVLFLSLNVEKDYYLKALVEAEASIIDIEHSLVYGNPIAGVPDLTQKCLLLIMYNVEKMMKSFKDDLKTIQDAGAVTRTVLLRFAETAIALEHEMQAALEQFEHYEDNCDAVTIVDKKRMVEFDLRNQQAAHANAADYSHIFAVCQWQDYCVRR